MLLACPLLPPPSVASPRGGSALAFSRSARRALTASRRRARPARGRPGAPARRPAGWGSLLPVHARGLGLIGLFDHVLDLAGQGGRVVMVLLAGADLPQHLHYSPEGPRRLVAPAGAARGLGGRDEYNLQLLEPVGDRG